MKERFQRFTRRFGYDVVQHQRLGHTSHTHIPALLDRLDVNVFLDVGANTGQTGQRLRQHGYQGLIVSFEPVAATFRELEAAAQTDPGWRCYQFAVGDDDGELALYRTGRSDFASVYAPTRQGLAEYGDLIEVAGTEIATQRRLDTLLPTLPLPDNPRAFLKIDTQGHELAVIAGAAESLDRIVGVQVEVLFEPTYDGAPLFVDVLAGLHDAGFKPLRMFADEHPAEVDLSYADFVLVRQRSDAPASQFVEGRAAPA